MGEKSAKKVCV